ncbi:MAG: hypothetical protein QOJ79_2947, partial [Actinomycetota bacterium]|nr:hypothetical protein [Actinomycetota bacterium]
MRLVARRAAVLLLALLGLTPALLAGLSQGVGASSLGSYQAAVLSDAPVGYWRLGERSGAVAADSSGAGRSGSYSGGVSLGVAGALVGDGDTS